MIKLKGTLFGYILLQLLFWMLFFTLARTIFLVYQAPLLNEAPLPEILSSYWYGWKMDLSMSAYLLVFPYLFISLQWLLNKRWLPMANSLFMLTVAFIISVIVSSELELFTEWETKLNYKAISYLKHPSEVAGVTSNVVMFVVILVICIQLAIAYWLHKKLIWKMPVIFKGSWAVWITFVLVIPALLILMIRGGFQQVPMNQSAAYYSKNNVLNNAAVNSTWNTIFSIIKNRKYNNNNPYRYYEPEVAQATVSNLYDFPKDSTTHIIKGKRPNIAMIILEGWSADLVKPMGGYDSITPNFNELCEDGLLFTNIYAAGLRSHEGMAAIFSGFPGQPVVAITSDPSKYPGIPTINKEMSANGYYSFYGFGGELNYGNIKSYLVYAGFDQIIEGNDFPASIPRAKLGVHDEYALDRYLKELGEIKQPFFASWFTLSSHAPYDIPVKYSVDINGIETGYVNSVNYTDKCLGDFFERAKQQSWYANTIFIIVADHGHSSPKKTPFYSPDYRKIPLLFYGDALREEFRGATENRIGSQTDLPVTLLAQLSIDQSAFKWSKNLLNPDCPQFAYFSFDDGLGWIEPGNQFSYHHELQRYFNERYENEEKKQEIIKKGKAYLQAAFQEYVDL